MSQPRPFYDAAIDASRQAVILSRQREARRQAAEDAAREEAERYLRMLGDNYVIDEWDNGMLQCANAHGPPPYFERPWGW